MKAIKVTLPKNLDNIEIYTFSDLHIGDKFSDLTETKTKIDYIAKHDNAYAILNGDIMNNATKTSISDSYAEELSPMEQLQVFVELFEPIKKKILCITQGNHENRTYIKEGIDLTEVAARELKLVERYSKTGAVLFLKVGQHNYHGRLKPVCYSFYIIHGSGGGRKEGAKAIRLADMASIVDVDIYIHGHTHLPMIMKQGFFRTDLSNSAVKHVDKLFVNASAQLNYGGYGEAFEMKAPSKECPIIYLSGKEKHFYAKL